MVAQTRVHLRDGSPATFKALLALNEQAALLAAEAELDGLLVELIKIRVSQLNGCAFCLRMHTRDAVKAGETPERLAVLPTWRETDYFSAHERAALELSEAITFIAGEHVPDSVYAAAASHLSDAQIAAVSWLAIVMNTFNRVAIASRYVVGPTPLS
jgi:AhpD family alkylhydroperoxidase